MDRLTQEQLNKLPKWAETHLHKLYAYLGIMEAAEKLRDVEGTNLQWQAALDTKWHGLPEGSTVRFLCDAAQFDVSLRDEELVIYEFGRARRLYTEPRAANHVVITTEERIVARAKERERTE